ncbi:probable WRKY transcription factor 27 isoform X2 [Jatropha curcas]|uniref:probable WRKY transcription factor 27 isoform X2 n=1 Tax=Jatropha curcas TaxID=180498 RepID=UPI0005FC104E|nr:probable WRKY transcription factor 27 isoform X2 [Jatropha curcas]
MGEFTLTEDWDLQAVVRGRSTSEAASANIMNNNPPSVFAPLNLDQDDDLWSFLEIFESKSDLAGHEEICKPFLRQQARSAQSNPTINTSSSDSMSIISNCEMKEPDQKLQKQQAFSGSASPVIATDATMAAKLKRSRKNQQKRVVKHVTEDGLSSDMWAWRKYGQKPIKGSPYPRSYYRCSSLKGCLARKQVERSSSDPSIFIINYTGEHSHAHPTRRNSLAGSTRIKSTMAKQAVAINEPNNMQNIKKDETFPSSSTTPSMTSTEEDQLMQNVRIKNEEEEQVLDDGGSNEIPMQDIVFTDDMFPSLEDFEGLFNMDHQFAATVA